jgi:hypothetical protein
VQLLVEHCVLYVQALPRELLHTSPDPEPEPHSPSRAAVRTHCDGSWEALMACWSQFMWHMKSLMLHIA